jgi:hypothetical protein
MSDLHRYKGAIHNFSVMWKIREDSRNKRETKWAHSRGAHPSALGARPLWWPITVNLTDYVSTAFED